MSLGLGLGIGPSWQSWTRIDWNLTRITRGAYHSSSISLRQKISPNATFSANGYLYFKPISKQSSLSLKIGCRYADWGQAKNIGIIREQQIKVAPKKPIKIKKVYSFAPYIGLEFNF